MPANGSLARLERVMETGFNTLADLIRETNARLGQVEVRLDVTNARLDETNARLAKVEVRLDETNARLAKVEVRLDETNARLGRLEGRFDNFLKVAGTETRRLRQDVDKLGRRVDRLERKTG